MKPCLISPNFLSPPKKSPNLAESGLSFAEIESNSVAFRAMLNNFWVNGNVVPECDPICH